MSAPAVSTIEIFVAWDRIGFVATTPGSDAQSSHTAGPREAAHQLAKQQFGHPDFTLRFLRRGAYTATEKGGAS